MSKRRITDGAQIISHRSAAVLGRSIIPCGRRVAAPEDGRTPISVPVHPPILVSSVCLMNRVMESPKAHLSSLQVELIALRQARPRGADGNGPPAVAPLSAYFFFGSRFCRSSSGVTEESTPLLGTSALAIHRMALRTALRWLTSPQLACVCPPVKPKPRPPPGRV